MLSSQRNPDFMIAFFVGDPEGEKIHLSDCSILDVAYLDSYLRGCRQFQPGPESQVEDS